MDARARVLRVHEGRATLACDEATACSGCAPGRGCGLRWLGGNAPRRQQLVLPAARGDGAPLLPGDSVTLSVADGELLRSAARLYLPPIAGLLLGPLLARHALHAGEGLATLAAACGLLCGWLLARFWVGTRPPAVQVMRTTDGPGTTT